MCYNQIRVFLFDYLMILLLSVLLISGNEVHDTEEVDLSKCKLTQLGTEYRGSKMVTSSNVRCQYWQTDQPLHKVILCLVLLITIDYQHMVNPNITDADFPEKSMKAAKNYCRNPTKDPRGPWCYTLDPTLIDDECDIPLCNFGDCRISGTGAEYAGDRKISSSGKKCKSWAGKHKVSNNKSPAFAKKNFPDASLKKANRFCRNPDNNIGGPWCYVHDETYETIEKEYCDIPFCDDRDCLVYVRNTSRYSTLTTLNSTIASIKFWIKLWNPNDEYNGEFKILLSLLPIPTFASKIAEDWHVGVELMFSNFGSGQTYPDTNMDDYENTPSILLGSKWTGIWITWAGGFISMGMYGTSKPFFVGEYKKKDTISGLYYDFLSYYGIMGTNVLWSTEFCQSDCETHVTVGTEFTNVWPMQKSNNTYDIHFYVRANRNIAIQMYQNPINIYPCFTIIIDNVTSLIYQKSKFSMKQYLKQVSSKGLLNFWMWKKFTISILGPHLRLFYEQTYGDEEFLYVHYDLFDTLRWFSIGTEYNVAYWTLFCIPDGETHAIEDPWPPNCISDLMDYAYKGNQWFSVNEIPCIPWISKEIPEEDKIDSKFIDGSALRALNKCRNPGHSPDGPYCYIMTDPNTLSISKQYCPVRKCQSSECKMAGTANDYIGTLSTTRSGRTCAKWIADYELVETKVYAPETTTQGHLMELPRRYVTQEELPLRISPQKKPTLINVLRPKDSINRTSFNDSLYAEHSAKNASNYCRNPSRNIAGTWCYTTDPLVPQDLCDVRDCEMLEECIFLVHGHGIGRRLYVFPEYRSEGLHFSLKAWEPDQLDSITIVFTADDGFKSRYILKIGALDNEKILLYYQSESQDIDGPAIDGGWSEWGPWACSASCNGGVGTRTRLCNSPEPNVRGEPCIGPNSMTGRCNLIKCGDLTEDTIILIQRRIKRNHTSLIIKEYGTVVILSDHDIIQLISNTSVDLEIQWSHNGIFIKENNRIKIKDFNVGMFTFCRIYSVGRLKHYEYIVSVINRALLIDSGIYTITLRRVDQSYLVLKVVALAVMPNTESITIRETLPLSVICNCLILGYVYSDLKISWEINENIWKDYGITLPIAVNIDYVKAINKSHEGMWKCIVEQTDLNFKWITNIIVVKVIGSPNWRTYLMEDKLTSPIFGWMPSEKFVAVSALIIFLVLIGCIIIGSIFLIRLQESRKIKVQTSKQKKNKQ
uniref:uncharacterized protein LOC127063448 isoform X7 n=1 Tax=Vespula vulgaris TaxID=7454 RepID=UPI00223BA29F|nr:uncharacterized protein LOC127063448 isoform X7 [Vespula vulgaris]